jgi:hypothetical protein
VIALTPRLAGLITRARVPKERVHVIPSGVPDGVFDVPHAGEPDGLPPRPRVVFLGRLHVQKAVDVLVRAVVTSAARPRQVSCSARALIERRTSNGPSWMRTVPRGREARCGSSPTI